MSGARKLPTSPCPHTVSTTGPLVPALRFHSRVAMAGHLDPIPTTRNLQGRPGPPRAPGSGPHHLSALLPGADTFRVPALTQAQCQIPRASSDPPSHSHHRAASLAKETDSEQSDQASAEPAIQHTNVPTATVTQRPTRLNISPKMISVNPPRGSMSQVVIFPSLQMEKLSPREAK